MTSLENIDELPNDQCLEIPISAQAENLMNYRHTLEGKNEDLEIQGRIVANYEQYVDDYFAEANVFGHVALIYDAKIQELDDAAQGCSGNECTQISQERQIAQQLKQTYANKEYTASNEALIAGQTLTQQQNIIAQKNNEQIQAKNNYDSEKTNIDSLRATCEADLDDKKSALNAQLDLISSLESDIAADSSYIIANLPPLKAKTAELVSLSDQIDVLIQELRDIFTNS